MEDELDWYLFDQSYKYMFADKLYKFIEDYMKQRHFYVSEDCFVWLLFVYFTGILNLTKSLYYSIDNKLKSRKIKIKLIIF